MTDVRSDEEPANQSPEWWREGDRPTWDDFVAALAALTIAPLRPGAGRRIGRSALFYPVIGLALGCLWVVVDQAAAVVLPPWARAVFVLAVWLVITAGRQLVGCARTAAAVVAGRNRQRALELMNAAGLDAAGVVALLAVIAIQLHSLAALNKLRLPALLFAPMLACWSVVVLAHGSRAARADGRLVKYAREVGFREFALASVLTFGVLFSLAEATGIAVGVCVATVLVALRVLFHGWLGGVTDAAVAAGAECTFTLVLVCFSALERAR